MKTEDVFLLKVKSWIAPAFIVFLVFVLLPSSITMMIYPDPTMIDMLKIIGICTVSFIFVSLLIIGAVKLSVMSEDAGEKLCEIENAKKNNK